MHIVVSCRPYKPGTLNDLAPGYILGQKCVICSQALQVSPRGLAMIEAGGRPLCNQCSFRFIDAIGGPKELAGIMISPQAQEQIDRMIREMRTEKEKTSA